MGKFDVVTQELPTGFENAFAFIAEPRNLPKWALAFREADGTSALIARAGGEEPVRIGLKTTASIETGVIDWTMEFPDGSITRALSRVIGLSDDRCLYTFLFFARPVPDDQVAATLSSQKKAIEEEFGNLVGCLGEGRSTQPQPTHD